MPRKLVIAGSASLQEKIQYWKKFWENKGFAVTGHPQSISDETFLRDYPQIHADFFQNLADADILFAMNEDKNGISGYLGAESFAEMSFAVAQNLIYHKKIKIIILQMPDRRVQSYAEIILWLKLGWIILYNDNLL